MNDIKPGRKPADIDVERMLMLLDLGVPKTKVAVQLGIGRATLYRILASPKIEGTKEQELVNV